MIPERHQRVMEILGEAIDRSPESRDAWIANACAGDETLCREVVELLADDLSASSFLEESPFDAAVQTETKAESVIGRRIGPYKIIREIGRGGMGAVYLGERNDEEFAQRAAIKLIKRGMDTDFVLQRFRNERQILASLDHPNIGRLLDGGTTADGLPYFIMEYIEGERISDYADVNKLTTVERLKLFRTVCSAVQYAHQNLVIHRDIKPSNILVTKDGEPKLLDFGVAKLLQTDTNEDIALTATAVRIMTPDYASPEQVQGGRVTTSTDIYSLGILLYELLTGQRPFQIRSLGLEDFVKAIREQQPEKPSQAVSRQVSAYGSQRKAGEGPTTGNLRETNPKLRGDLDNIILKALRKEPERRYASAEQFSEDIGRHLEGLPVSARRDTFSYRAGKFIQRNKIGVAAAALVAFLLVGGIATTAWEAHQARLATARAQLRFDEVRELAHSVVFDYHDAIASLPGSTPVRERLVKDALKYLDNLAGDEGNGPSLQRELATAYLKVGDVQGRPYVSNLGQSEAALASYLKAATILERLSGASQFDKELSRDLATAYERIGNIQLRKGNWAEALRRNNQAMAMRQALLATDPSNKAYRSEVADSYLYVGDAIQAPCLDVECVRSALQMQRQALAIRNTLSRESPTDLEIRRGVAQAHARIGFRLELIGQRTGDKEYWLQWLENEQIALAIRKELAAANPTNAFDRRSLADQLMLTANARLGNEDTVGALDGYHDALEIFEGLSSADPTNSEARRDLSFLYFRLGAAYARIGNTGAARENYTAIIPIDAQLLAEDATNQEDLQNLSATYSELENLARAEGDLVGAIEIWRKVLALRCRMLAITPDNSSYGLNLASSYSFMGMLCALTAGAHTVEGETLDAIISPPTSAKQVQQWREAKDWYQKSLDLYRDLKTKGILNGEDANKPDEVAKEIAKCDVALKKA